MIREYCKRIGVLLGGLLISAVGITMMLQANIGLEPWSVLQNGMSLFFGMTYGTAAMIVGATVIIVAILMGESFGIGTIANWVLVARRLRRYSYNLNAIAVPDFFARRFHDDAPVGVDADHQLSGVRLAHGVSLGRIQQIQGLADLPVKGPAPVIEDDPVGAADEQRRPQLGLQPLDALGDVGRRNLILFGSFGEVFRDGGVTKISQLQKFHRTPLYHHFKHIVGYVI